MMYKNGKAKTPRINLIIIITGIFIVVASILYMLADRYLIEHVELIVSEPPSPGSISSKAVSSTDISDSPYSNSTPLSSTLPNENIGISHDDWNYKSANISINIKKVESGSGNDKVTYFVADVALKDSSYLMSAFAKNKFGRNIVEKTSKIASDNGAIFAVNGDYYGFRGDGIIIRNGAAYRNVPVRAAAALYKDGIMKTIDEREYSPSVLLMDGVMNTFSFGPVLVKNSSPIEDFGAATVDTNFGNHSIGGFNPRTGIGMIAPNHFIFIVVDGRMENYSRGMKLPEFAKLFYDYRCTNAYNLDGGGSSTMYFMGRVVNNPQGNQRERAISDILFVKE